MFLKVTPSIIITHMGYQQRLFDASARKSDAAPISQTHTELPFGMFAFGAKPRIQQSRKEKQSRSQLEAAHL